MAPSASLRLLAIATLIASALPAVAQTARGQASYRYQPSPPEVGVAGHVFVPGFGLRPIIQERRPQVDFGGFRRHRGFGFHRGFGGAFHFGNFYGFGYAPFYPATTTSPTVIIIQQAAPAPDPERVRTLDEAGSKGSVVVAGLPDDWDQVRLSEVNTHRERPAEGRLTLLALEDETILPVADYWLEDGLIFYVTATWRQGSVPLRELDWEMTTQLNAERGVDFVLRSPR